MPSRFLPALFAALLFVACAAPPRGAPTSQAIRPLPADEWPRIQDDLDLDSLARASEHNLSYLRGLGEKTFLIGASTVGARRLVESVEALLELRRKAGTPAELETGLKDGFELFRVMGATQGGGAFFSAYYQPILPASPKRTERFAYPLYRRPPDLVTVDLGAFNPKYNGETISARLDAGGRLVPYFNRRDIDVRKQLEGRGLEAAWLDNGFDRLDLHIQGSGLLRFPDGRFMIAKYAANNGAPYKSAGMALVGSGAMTREEATKAAIKQYLIEHPEGEGWLLSQNPRYVFFDVSEAPEDGMPFGTIERALTPGRSIAVDPKSIPLGVPAYARLPLPQADAQGRLLGKAESGRFVLCQDTGGAIQGPGRVDLFLGHGPDAKTEAAKVWDSGELYLILKKLPPRRR
ncbi:MAG: MltA domain-containing protein [Elusimicrobia bacterium]|nr:MltA domain-containing protein [Elusimicrobiota bacterium]